MKVRRWSILVKVPLIVIGIVVLCFIVTIVLTDPAPRSLPRRMARMLAEIRALFSPPSAKDRSSPPLVNVPIAGPNVAENMIAESYFVVGIEINGQSRAYPLNMLSRPDHHVINDTLGGQPIAVTWCGLCQSPVVYSRLVETSALTFFVSGELYGENMVMTDVETNSDWPQLLGEATSGPLTGKSLETIPSVWTDWKSWRDEHPESTLLKISQTIDYYRHDSDAMGGSFGRRYFAFMQWGLARGEKSVSWPFDELTRRGVVNDALAGLPFVVVFEAGTTTVAAFDRRVAGTELTFHMGADGLIDDQTRSLWERVTGRAVRGPLAGRRLSPVAGVVAQQRAWRTLHPQTAIRGRNAS